ncbi:MAG: hypothetical protein SAMD01599839_08360 [Rectinema sp.]
MNFFDRIKLCVREKNTTIEDLLDSAFEDNPKKVSRDSYNGWKRRNNLPRINEVYPIARYLGKTIEWLYDGERGQEFVEGIMAKDGKLYRPPERIAGIVEDLATLDDEEILRFAKQIHVIAEDARKGANEKSAI